ncbi:MAG TPA: pyridoxal phosphate-dependent aminotransferase [Thermoanaerobaculia bacterium]|nr:pyridoxal phosphate-dependent aminotransferase [Thermoanaerobaculia bacterium]
MSHPRLSKRAVELRPSSTAAVARAAKALAASGADVVDFGLGEPDFATPRFVAEAGVAAIGAGRTKYTDVAGEPALRDAIAEKYRNEQGAGFARENVVVTAGAKQAVFNACQALFQEGDRVAIFSPYWVSFPEIVRLSGAEPVLVSTDLDSGWQVTAQRLAASATEPIRGVIVNSPNNPTGAVTPPEEIGRLLDWCASHDAFLIFDETYDRFLYDDHRHVSAAAFAEHRDRVVVTGAASKTYAMTGWRLGWAAGPQDIVAAMTSFQSHSTSNASSISQAAVLAALKDPERTERSVGEMLAQYTRRRKAMIEGLQGIRGVRACWPQGSFYAFADVSALFGPKGVSGSASFCERLLREARVAAVPGDAFGNDACVRFSFATGMERVEEGIRRLAAWSAN